jgi:RND family efflux transporter MFP subunit
LKHTDDITRLLRSGGRIYLSFLFLTLALLQACSKPADTSADKPKGSLITVAQAQAQDIEILEHAIGQLESLIDPTIAAEVSARVEQVLVHSGQSVKAGQLMAVLDNRDVNLEDQAAQAEARRLETLLANQKHTVARYNDLIRRKLIPQNQVDDAQAQEQALKDQLDGARARVAQAQRGMSKTRVHAPVDARVETQIVSPGDFVRVGDPLFKIVGEHRLHAHLPFPEAVVSKLSVGLTVRLSTPTAPQDRLSGKIHEIKPLIGTANRAVDVIVKVDDQRHWQAGASVNGEVVLGKRAGAILVPEQSVVLRPAGEVVYVINGDKATQRVVTTGQRSGATVEIASGLAGGETIAADGAGFLSDQAVVRIAETPKPMAQP